MCLAEGGNAYYGITCRVVCNRLLTKLKYLRNRYRIILFFIDLNSGSQRRYLYIGIWCRIPRVGHAQSHNLSTVCEQSTHFNFESQNSKILQLFENFLFVDFRNSKPNCQMIKKNPIGALKNGMWFFHISDFSWVPCGKSIENSHMEKNLSKVSSFAKNEEKLSKFNQD